eukprot:CAMPEP_0179007058 /NCGR_PEP_ID=MMETSP0795-20121207/14930_1 /TAXON_ID=88552 /ORGANISM="Amoebophrya sp., Strain Ameob2" /LENGTH=147 /DNA_ID=CAMNT_0020701951 /DNA_START=62 /DNA_END=505 /DNA_ORIENTATION=-
MPGKKDLGAQVHKTGTDAGAMMGKLEEGLKNLEREINADKTGLIEMNTHLIALRKEKADLEAKIQSMQDYCDSLVSEASIGGVLKQFDAMEGYLKNAYGKVREGHAKGIDMLKKEFGYHPAYKRGHANEFSASYFTPCSDPNNPNKR